MAVVAVIVAGATDAVAVVTGIVADVAVVAANVAGNMPGVSVV